MNRTIASLSLAFALLGAAPAWADVSREQAAAIAQQVAGGRVLSVERAGGGARGVWRVKVITPQGVVRVVQVDAASGQAY